MLREKFDDRLPLFLSYYYLSFLMNQMKEELEMISKIQKIYLKLNSTRWNEWMVTSLMRSCCCYSLKKKDCFQTEQYYKFLLLNSEQ